MSGAAFESVLCPTHYDPVHILCVIDIVLMALHGLYLSITLMMRFSINSPRMSLSDGVTGLRYKRLINEEGKKLLLCSSSFMASNAGQH